MRPNFKTQILNPLVSGTYNFTPIKCTHFLARPAEN
jgi:hypothetical protein